MGEKAHGIPRAGLSYISQPALNIGIIASGRAYTNRENDSSGAGFSLRGFVPAGSILHEPTHAG
jgi:hypothetical protein